MSRKMNWDRVRRERNLIKRRHYSDDELFAMAPVRQHTRRSTRQAIPVCPVCTLMHPGEC